MAIGPAENLGINPGTDGNLNFAFQAGLSLVEAFRTHFDSLWEKAFDVILPGATDIPELVLPKGSEEAARCWESYQSKAPNSETKLEAHEAQALDKPSPEELPVCPSPSPTERIGVKALDPLAEFVSRLYGQGSLGQHRQAKQDPSLGFARRSKPVWRCITAT